MKSTSIQVFYSELTLRVFVITINFTCLQENPLTRKRNYVMPTDTFPISINGKRFSFKILMWLLKEAATQLYKEETH